MTIGRLTQALVMAAAVVPRSAAKSPGIFAVEWRLRLGPLSVAELRDGSKADITVWLCDVRFTPESGHSSAQSRARLCLTWPV